MWRSLILLIGLGSAGSLLAQPSAVVYQAQLRDQAINPATAEYLIRAIDEAEQAGAECLIIVLDTPGGLVSSTRQIVRRLLNSEVPVVVYVAPPGARAGSAGVFITLAGHVAAIAPGANIGAAHPVQVGGLPGSPGPTEGTNDDSPMRAKIVNDTVAWARSLAELRGRNADWAENAVRNSESVTASEAAAVGAVDFVAETFDELLRRIDGTPVTLASGNQVTLHTKNPTIRELDMWWGERLLVVLTNPNIAFLLLILGFYGVLFELYSPGWGISGTLGVVCLILGLYSLSVLPVNLAGLGLLVVALALFVAEAFVTSFGALAAAGVACLILGGTMLIDSPEGFQKVSYTVLIPIALGTAAITVFLLRNVIRAYRQRPITGRAALMHATGRAIDAFQASEGHYHGQVHIAGELWRGVSSQPVQAGDPILVIAQEGLTLQIQPMERPVKHH